MIDVSTKLNQATKNIQVSRYSGDAQGRTPIIVS
jgi:hypothetical protein